MLKRFVKFICVVLCIVMLLPFAAVAEGYHVSGDSKPYIDPDEPIVHGDLKEGSWYTPYCTRAYYDGYMVGTSDTTFSPNEIVTREMATVIIVSIVLKENNKELPHYTTIYFSDVAPDKWYSDSIQWAYENKITAGIGNNKFGLGQPVTRQDFATMLYNISAKDRWVPSFYEENQIEKNFEEEPSEYAKEAIRVFTSWVMGTASDEYYDHLEVNRVPPVIQGYPDGTYRLKGSITRAEMATMVFVFTFRYNYNVITLS